MTQLLEIKNTLIRFYGKWETYVRMGVKFLTALVLFTTINSSIGYMEKISTVMVALILSLLCCILPANAIIWLAAIVVIADMYALALEAAIVTLIVFLIIMLLYFRFAPKDGMLAVLTPVMFHFHIPYIMPMASGLLRPAYSVLSVACGTLVYYFVDGVHQNASVLAGSLDEEADMGAKFNVIIGQLTGNKEMLLVMGIFIFTALIVYFLRRCAVEYAWTISIIIGTVVQIIGLFVGYTIVGISGKGVALIIGNIVSMLICFVIQFFVMNLDYARTERVQFEDDEYYYYVVAVPKKMIATREKKVQRFGATTSMGKRIDKSKDENLMGEDIDRKKVAEEFDIDEELLK